MKRSEMLELIYETIYQHNKKPDITMYEMAELILRAQERVGMLPPEISEEIADNEYGCEEEGSTTIYVNKWKPEDET